MRTHCGVAERSRIHPGDGSHAVMPAGRHAADPDAPDSLERRRNRAGHPWSTARSAPRFELESRAHADGALVAFAVVADLLDGVEHPVVRTGPSSAPKLPSAPSRRRTSEFFELRLHLLDIRRTSRPAPRRRWCRSAPSARSSCQRSSPQRVTGPCGSLEIDLGQDDVVVRDLELDALAGERADAGGVGVAAAGVIGRRWRRRSSGNW